MCWVADLSSAADYLVIFESHLTVVFAQEKIYPGGGAGQFVIPCRDGWGCEGYMLTDPFHLVVNLYPVTGFVRKNFAMAVAAAAAWAVYHLFGAA